MIDSNRFCGCAMETLEARALPSTGGLDNAFGRRGLLAGPGFGMPTSSDSGQVMMALQGDGKIVLASRVKRADGDAQVSRYLPRGRLDRSFGTKGRILIDVDDLDVPAGLAVEPGGGILVLVSSSSADFSSRSARLLRFTASGRRDRRFASHGVFALDPADRYGQIRLGANHTILIDDEAEKVMQLTSTGQLKSSFAASGILTMPAPQTPSVPPGGSVNTNSTETKAPKYVASIRGFVGLSHVDFIAVDAGQNIASDIHTLTIHRYSANGKADSGFGAAGVATIDMKSATGLAIDSLSIADFATLSSGKLVLAGHISTTVATGAGPDFIMRVNPNGTIDRRFANKGFFWFDRRITTLLPTGHGGLALAARIPKSQSSDDILVARLNIRGQLVRKFGDTGTISINLGAHDYPETLLRQPNDQLVVLGTRSKITPNFEYLSTPVIARINQV
jgi:uncharacterized delta-60 repeat protein